MARDFIALQVLQQMFANIEQSESEEEAEDVSEEDGEECAENMAEEEEEEEQDGQDYAEHVSEEEDGQEYDAVNDDAAAAAADQAPQTDRDTFVSRNGQIEWCSIAYRRNPRLLSQRDSTARTPRGPTAYAVSHAHDIVSAFLLFVTPQIERVILDVTNREGYLKRGEEWKAMDALTYVPT